MTKHRNILITYHFTYVAQDRNTYMKKRTNTYTTQHRNAFMDQQIPFVAGFIEGLASVMIALIYAF